MWFKHDHVQEASCVQYGRHLGQVPVSRHIMPLRSLGN
jgi:hypothetical protein